MRRVMDYPNDRRTSELYDGQTHEIEPITLRSIKVSGSEIFLMEYVDLSLGERIMNTLLEKKDGKFVKVPLSNYGKDFKGLYDLFIQLGKKCDLGELSQHISTRRKPIDLVSYLEESKHKQDVAIATITPIFYNFTDGKYYSNPQCTISINDNPVIVEYRRTHPMPTQGDEIQATETMFFRINIVNINSKERNEPPKAFATQTPIYYNEADGKYYSNPDCTISLENHPAIIEYRRTHERPKQGDEIKASDYLYFVVNIIRRKTLAATERPVYYNWGDGKFYGDPMCTISIENHPAIVEYRRTHFGPPNENERFKVSETMFFVVKYAYVRELQRQSRKQPSNSGGQPSNFEKQPTDDLYAYATRTPIFYNLEDRKYYANPECSISIEDLAPIINYRRTHPNPIEGDKIQATPTHFLIINFVKVKKKTDGFNNNTPQQNGIRQIFYNSSDGNYYWDKACTSKIEGAPYVLGNLTQNMIKGRNGTDYVIVNVKKLSSDLKSMFEPKKRSAKNVYFNKQNEKLYWDKECTMEVEGGIKALGILSGNMIVGNDTIYYVHVVTFEDTSSSGFHR